MTPDIKEKLNRFIKDERMSEAVKQVILNSFLKSQATKEVNYLAACRIAIDLLEDAWKELLKFKVQESEKSVGSSQIGL